MPVILHNGGDHRHGSTGVPAPVSDMPPEGSWAGVNWSAPITVGDTGQVQAYPYRGVWLIEAEGPVESIIDALDHSIQTALAECPRGVVCGLPRSLADAEAWALDVLALMGRHVRAWPDTPLVLASRDPALEELLASRPGGDQLGFAASMLRGWTQIMHAPPPLSARLHLPPEARSPRAGRAFVTQACSEWGLESCAESAALVVSELVTNAVQHTNTAIDVLLTSYGTVLRVGVRDRDPSPPQTRHGSAEDLGGRGLRVVEGLARDYGAFPTADGGKLVWASVGAVTA